MFIELLNEVVIHLVSTAEGMEYAVLHKMKVNVVKFINSCNL